MNDIICPTGTVPSLSAGADVWTEEIPISAKSLSEHSHGEFSLTGISKI